MMGLAMSCRQCLARRTAALSLIILAMSAVVGSGPVGAPAPRLPEVGRWQWPEEHIECVAYVVGRGDSPRAIAHRYYPDHRADEVLWAIWVVNGLADGRVMALSPGDVILIPDPIRYGFRKR